METCSFIISIDLSTKINKQKKNYEMQLAFNFGHKPALNIQPFYKSSQLHYVAKEGLQEETRSFFIILQKQTNKP